jgi:leucyl-tRNA synthetase
MEYDFREIEKKCKKYWADNNIYHVEEDTSKPKYYVLDMFPYPSGAGLHVGHPLGYVASDIYARYKRLKGFNVLHPMGYDAFGLPAEQYAIETGTHPAITTEKAIARYREQLDKIGFSFDWDRQVKTCDPDYYKWTQWIFLKLFNSWYNREKNKAEPIETLIAGFEKWGCTKEWSQFDETLHPVFSAEDWKAFPAKRKERILQFYRIAFRSYTEVNWCEALGCVLANDEVKDGKSERGGYPVTRKKMRQWSLRITEYADRLLEGLNRIDWSDSLKEQQRNWIGRSEGCILEFNLSQTLSGGEGLNSQHPRYHTTDAQTWSTSIVNAKEMRKNPTEAESMVWDRLKASQTGYKFRRQHPVDKYIVDFVCLKKGLVVEIDGKIHDEQKDYDAVRTNQLEKYGLRVIRFTNEEVIADTENIINKILTILSQLADRNSGGDSIDDAINEQVDEHSAVQVPPAEGFREVSIQVFTTRVDTLFGATFLVIAPEHEFIQNLITDAQRSEMDAYLAYVGSRSDIERQQEKKITGCFTGSFAIHPFTGKQIPIWTAEYVLAGYGTGAIMAVPADDERDKKFAEKFGLPIVEVIDKSMYPGATIEDKKGKMINSDFLNGLEVLDAIEAMITKVEELGIGKRKVNYKLRDASYSRQRYWGEPFPIRYDIQENADSPFLDTDPDNEADIPVALSEAELPLVLPDVESYKPTGDGRSPLATNADWVSRSLETDTMPGYAGSSWYYFRYMDPKNPDAFAAKEKLDYWQNVDIYFGGAEHAVGHLLYSRFWHKVLFDLGYVNTDEPFKKLVNQGMIQGVSAFVYRVGYGFQHLGVKPLKTDEDFRNVEVPAIFVTKEIFERYEKGELTTEDREKIKDKQAEAIQILIDKRIGGEYQFPPEPVISKLNEFHYLFDDKLVDGKLSSLSLNLEAFRLLGNSRLGNSNSLFVLNEFNECLSQYEPEKMSKSKYNVVNPDDVIEKYGADCFRMFEMFLGPIEQSKPWDDKGISGVANFLRKFWRLFYDDKGNWKVIDDSNSPPSEGLGEAKVLHKTIKKIADDIERLNFNTSVSAFMIATNELTSLGCNKRSILQPLVIALAPFAPFITEELWSALGNSGSVHTATFPAVEEKYLVESTHNYAVSINGKVRAEINLPADVSADEAKAAVLELDKVKQHTNGAEPKKFIFVKGKIINVVV